jgi:hypothetical protein
MKFIFHYKNKQASFFAKSLEDMSRNIEEFFQLPNGQFSILYKDEDGDPIHLQIEEDFVSMLDNVSD